MTEELKACPFCGGPMTLKVSRSNGHQIFGSHTKECAFSDISTCMQEPSDCEWVADEIIKRWNTRAQLPSQGGEAVAWRVTGRGGITVTGQYPEWAEADCLLTITPLYTHPAGQVAEPDAELVALLRDERTYNGMAVLCQAGLVARCLCHHCRMKRIDAKLASLNT